MYLWCNIALVSDRVKKSKVNAGSLLKMIIFSHNYSVFFLAILFTFYPGKSQFMYTHQKIEVSKKKEIIHNCYLSKISIYILMFNQIFLLSSLFLHVHIHPYSKIYANIHILKMRSHYTSSSVTCFSYLTSFHVSESRSRPQL